MLKRTSKQLSMFSSLEDMLSHEHPLFQLSNKINWECFEFASARVRTISNMSLAIKYLFFAHGQDLFLVHVLLGMNMMGILSKRR